jgi:hypothetical protein
MALTGTLEEVSFAELVQVINQGRKTGQLIVRRLQEEARVHFCQGEIAQASLTCLAPMEPINGAEVIYRLLGWKKAEFEFHLSQGLLRRQIQQTTDELILEGMKRLDEWEKVEEELADMNVVLRVKAGNIGDRYDELSDNARVLLRLVDASRDVATIIRESGIDPSKALLAITELMTQEAVEKWDSPAPALFNAAAGRG